jgi:peptidoglycan/LPS O-acetylase OafA/YrhL
VTSTLTPASNAPVAAAVKVGPSAKMTYLPGLDGLRAVSVVAVLLYHAGITWMGGGFLGVEVFFVISGYLITLLLIGEQERTGVIDLRQFWLRRARRLLPALYTLLVTVGIVTIVFFQEEAAKWRGDVVAALFYVTNWYLIATGSSYFDQFGRPSPFKHLWSLAVEEQFYLVWPLIVLGLFLVFKRNIAAMAIAFALMITASTVLMALWYDASDPSRVYYGTLTRAGGLVAGALLALFWRPGALARARAGRNGRTVDALGLVGLAGIGFFYVVASEKGAFLYHGGFLLVGALTLLVIAAVTHPRSLLAGKLALGNPVLVYLGTRSYGLYLWHWPVFVFLRPGEDVAWDPNVVLAVRLLLTFVLTELSFRLVEQPIRGGAIGRWWAETKALGGTERIQRNRQAILGGTAALFVLALVGVGLASAKPVDDEITASLRAGERVLAAGPGTPSLGGAVSSTTLAPTTTVAVTTTAGPGPAATTVPAATATTAVAPTPETTAPATTAPAPAWNTPPGAFDVVFLGDSVMLGAAPQLKGAFGENVLIDATVSRFMRAAPGILQPLRDGGKIGSRVVVHLGNNGGLSADQIADVMGVLAGVERVVFVNLKLPRDYEGPTNRTLAAEVPKYPNARLVDWYAASNGQPGLFYKDGMHLRPEGAEVYAAKLQAALG